MKGKKKTEMGNFDELKQHVLAMLQKELDQNLLYHSVDHTLDVLSAAERIAAAEGINGLETNLLKTAAVMHDAGFIVQYFNNEPTACDMSREILPQFGYSSEDIEKICGMIMATRLPQSPKNHLEEIICDADLDYLGRTDFYTIGNRLFREFLTHGVVSDEKDWNRLQVRFLEGHHYFTKTNKNDRESFKQNRLQELKELVASYD